MPSNIEQHRADYDRLVQEGAALKCALYHKVYGDRYIEGLAKKMKLDDAKTMDFKKGLPNFNSKYQSWYTECIAIIRQLIPERFPDFVRHYEKPKGRKNITFENYRIEDALQGLEITRGSRVIADHSSAIPHFEQQLAILESAQRRLESSLFDIRQMTMADLFDSELDSARELFKNKFFRAAGVVAGVILEKHLLEVCSSRSVTIRKKNPTISTFNDALKDSGVIDVPTWRFIQHLGDIRNICGHGKGSDPTPEQTNDLIEGVSKAIKSIF